jgi:hypothetical protein
LRAAFVIENNQLYVIQKEGCPQSGPKIVSDDNRSSEAYDIIGEDG